MIIIGIDPSLTATGVYLDDCREAFTIKTKSKDGDRRLVQIRDMVDAIVLNRSHSLYVLEDLPISARAAGKTGMAHGVIRERILWYEDQYITLPPATLKKAAVGNGKAEKAAMIEGYRAAYPDVTITDDNQADAAWLAECGKALVGLPNKLACPEALDKYKDKVPWDYVNKLIARSEAA